MIPAVVMDEGLVKWQERFLVHAACSDIAISLFCGFKEILDHVKA